MSERPHQVCCICSRRPLPEDQDPRGSSELRPYGPGGAPICFECATRPENKATTDAQFNALLDAAEGAMGPGKLIVLSTDGPRTIEAEELATASEAAAYAVVMTAEVKES